MNDAPFASEPTPDERTMATLAEVLQLVGSWIAPLIIFLIKRDSLFVRFHALQALLLQGVYAIFAAVFMALWFSAFVLTMFHAQAHSSAPPPFFFILFPVIWLGFMGMWVLMLVFAIVYGIKASRGEWASYPVLGSLARRFLKMNNTPTI
jgi:uncharacterized membrane protein